MPEVLSGNLAQLPLLEILKLLSSEGQTGRLDLSDGANTGEIYLGDGSLAHAVTGAQIGETAVYTLMGWLQGDFSFVPDVAAAAGGSKAREGVGGHQEGDPCHRRCL
jgi:hypothetical protein